MAEIVAKRTPGRLARSKNFGRPMMLQKRPQDSTCLCDHTRIHMEDLTLRYRGRSAFRGVSMLIPSCEITAIIGPSGCGKTSLLTCINRLTDMIPGCTVNGRIRVGDVDVRDPQLNVSALRRRVGMIFQKPNPFPMSIRDNIELALNEHGVRNRSERAAITEKALRDVGLFEEVSDRLDRSALSLSGGQQQRLCMARALALRPEVLLCDEPCSALDPISSGVVEDLIVGLRGKYTVVIVTHNLAQARRIADNAAFFWVRDGAGALIEYGAAGDLFERPRHALTRAYVEGARG